MKNSKLLVIGKCPLPIGGVTIYVKRLCDWLKYSNIKYEYYDLKKFNFFSFYSAIFRNEYAHLNSSSPTLRLLFSVICMLSRTKALITYHGNIGRYGFIKNRFDALSIRFAFMPMVLNQGSLNIARHYNHKTILTSAYISELNLDYSSLSENTLKSINRLKQCYKLVACTNASNLSYDKDGIEIYGISYLVSYFKTSGYALIISDPSGHYRKRFKTMYDNILFIDYPHMFIEVLKLSDCFIRYTSTDGDSISIHEAMDCNIPVIATDVVSRPEGVLLVKFEDESDLQSKLNQIICRQDHTKIFTHNRHVPDIIKIYESIAVR